MYRIGVDLGGTNIVAGVVDSEKNIVARISTKTPKNVSYTEIVNSIYSVTMAVVNDVGISYDEIEKIGVCSPGTVNLESGIVEFAGNLNFHNVPLRSELENLFKTSVSVSNDGDAMAYGEFIAGAGKGTNNFISIVLGTGVGGAIIVNKNIIKGTNYAVGEIGHMVIDFDGEQCNCGRNGCFEAYASATALIKQAKLAIINNPDTVMWALADKNLSNVDAKIVFDAARINDKTAMQVFDNYIKYLACGITNLINIFQPDILCIGGGVGNQGEYLLSPIRDIIKRDRYSKYSDTQTKICASVLGDNAAIIGAAYI
ncbi:MAG: ROK family protein [Clostridia bacterium]|nr:ROK family protein [Clostridia bacterium]